MIRYDATKVVRFDAERHLYEHAIKNLPIAGVTSLLREGLSKQALGYWMMNTACDEMKWQIQFLLEDLKAMSVAEILDKYNETWLEEVIKQAKAAHRKISKDAADIGTQVHEWAYAYLKDYMDQPVDYPDLTTDEAKRSVEGFVAFVDEHQVRPTLLERIIFHEEHWYAGTCDFVGSIDGQTGCADWKTSKGFYPDYAFQTAAYMSALEYEFNRKMQARWSLRFDKVTGEFHMKEYTEHERDFEGFLSAKFLAQTTKKMEQELKDG